jgi:hypothetical protein
MSPVARVRPFTTVLRTVCWASVVGFLCVWLTTSAVATHDSGSSWTGSAVTQASQSLLSPVRQYVDLDLIQPALPGFPAEAPSLLAIPILLMVAIVRRSLPQYAPHAPPSRP